MRKTPATIKQEEIASRRDDILTHLLKGHKTADIKVDIAKRYDCSTSTVELDLTHCYAEIKNNSDPDLPENVNKHLMKYNQVFSSAMASKDHKAAIQALQGIERILHLHNEVPLVMLQQNNLNLESLSLPELQELLN